MLRAIQATVALVLDRADKTLFAKLASASRSLTKSIKPAIKPDAHFPLPR